MANPFERVPTNRPLDESSTKEPGESGGHPHCGKDGQGNGLTSSGKGGNNPPSDAEDRRLVDEL